MMEYVNGTWNTVGGSSHPGGILGVSLNQYEALMQRLAQIQNSFDRLLERETQRTAEHASFVAETKLRLSMVEKQMGEHIEHVQKQADLQKTFRDQVQSSLNGLQQQVAEIDRKADKFPNELRSRWKGISLFLSGGAIVLGALWSFFQGLWWIYTNVFSKAGN